MWNRITSQMNRKKNHSIDQKMSMNETSATIKATSLRNMRCERGDGHYKVSATLVALASPHS